MLKDLAKDAWQIAHNHGFHENADPNDVRVRLSWMALIHSEISEAVEAIRKPHLHHMIGEELADALIRIIESAEQMGIDIEAEVVKKMETNRFRPYKHGGKLA